MVDDEESEIAIPDSDVFVLEYDYNHATSPTKFADCGTIRLANRICVSF